MGSVTGGEELISDTTRDIVNSVWNKAAAFTRSKMKEEVQDTVNRVREAVYAQKECRHQHHCHKLADLWQAEDQLRAMLREIDIQEGAALVNQE